MLISPDTPVDLYLHTTLIYLSASRCLLLARCARPAFLPLASTV